MNRFSKLYRLDFTRHAQLLLFVALLFQLYHSCSTSRQNGSINSFHILPRSSWNAMEAKPYKTHVPVRITVHHEGTKLELTDDAAKKINAIQRWGMGPDKKWSDIPYHFLIAPGGAVYEGRDPYVVGETSTEYDPSGHLLICCLGNRDTDTVPAGQLQALLQLIHYASGKFNIPLDSLRTHKDFSRQTNCPGKYLSAYFENGFIKKELKKLE
jgi:hypothetical protein